MRFLCFFRSQSDSWHKWRRDAFLLSNLSLTLAARLQVVFIGSNARLKAQEETRRETGRTVLAKYPARAPLRFSAARCVNDRKRASQLSKTRDLDEIYSCREGARPAVNKCCSAR
jgi:hypothetical protein